jgi:lipopolysaccharide cholinephosphotransferase
MELEPFRKAAIELADVAATICERYGLGYTLLNESLWGAAEVSGFLPWSAGIQLGMLYDDFVVFLEKCKTELTGTDYYIADAQNCPHFDEVYVRLQKRSGVVLPMGREADQVYYDYFIDIIPIFYAGNTTKELRNMYNRFSYYYKCLHARKRPPDLFKISKIPRIVKNMYYYRQRDSDTYSEMMRYLARYGTVSTKYVLIPSLFRQTGVVRCAETYRQSTMLSFEGRRYHVPTKYEEWLREVYRGRTRKSLSRSVVNRAVLEGPPLVRRVQLVGLEMLVEFDRICRRHNLVYTIAFGTLLGAVRHRGFIPWDDDVDVLMPIDDYERFLDVAAEELDGDRFFLRTQETDTDCNLVFATIKRNNTVYCKANRDKYDTHLGVPMDIFPLYHGSNSRVVHWVQDRMCKMLKTVVWAHMGAEGEPVALKRWFYTQLAKIPHKRAYAWHRKIANWQKQGTGKYFYVAGIRNPFGKAYNKSVCFDDRIQLEFEGHMFYAPRNYEEILSYVYSEEWARYPRLSHRVAKHLPGLIDIGNLFIDYGHKGG